MQFDDSAACERFMGRWSRAVAPVFLDWFAAPPGRPDRMSAAGRAFLPRRSSSAARQRAFRFCELGCEWLRRREQVWSPSHGEQSQYLRIYMGHLRQKLEAIQRGRAACSPRLALAIVWRPNRVWHHQLIDPPGRAHAP